jgi:formate hydrogenlyase transcriptional activator
LAEERDRLSLLLEINNHIVSKLEANELFHAVAVSLCKHFGNELTSLWLVNKQTGSLERKYLDFPTGRGFVEKSPILVPGNFDREILRRRTPNIYSGDFAGLPAGTREAFRAEAILSLVLVPLVGVNGPLGVLAMCSRKGNAFRESDLDLLSQIGTQISLVLDNALAYERLRASHDDLQDQRLYLESEIRAEYNFEEMIGDSPVWRRVLHQITTVAPTDAGVLLLGETGTGKELIARAIHSRSQRRGRTLVKLSCAAVPMGLLESELFGHEKGAFTGALTKQIGRFELANKGTLFLDEVGDIPLELQTKLLRALQEQEFERLGNPHTIKVDVRVIAATNRDLSQMVKDRTFRQDLYYRLNVFPIVVPPLRERNADIELLVRHFVAKYATRIRKRIESIPTATMKVLRNYHWPGNVRELEHFIERAVILSPANVLQIPVEELLTGTVGVKIPTLKEGEREQILHALRACGGVVGGPTGAAARLGINRSTLNSRMRKLGISRADA